MRFDVDCLGRITVIPRMPSAQREEVGDMMLCWAPTPLGMVLRGCGDREMIVDELREMIGTHFRPAGFVLHGMVVAQAEDGSVFTVAARRNRVTSRQLWTAADAPDPGDCRVIPLDTRRRSPRTRDLPAGGA